MGRQCDYLSGPPDSAGEGSTSGLPVHSVPGTAGCPWNYRAWYNQYTRPAREYHGLVMKRLNIFQYGDALILQLRGDTGIHTIDN